MSMVGKSAVGAFVFAMAIATAGHPTAIVGRQVRPAYAVRQQTLYSFASESSSVVVKTWNPAAQRFEYAQRFVNVAGSPIAATPFGEDRFFLLTEVRRGHYAIYVLMEPGVSPWLGRLLWRGDASELLVDLIPDREGLVVVGRQKVFYLEHGGTLKYLGPGPEKTYRELSSVAADGKGRIAFNEEFGLVEYDISGGQLVERCRLPGKPFAVSAIHPYGDGWIVLGTSQAAERRIFRVRQCEATPLSEPFESQSWLMASAPNTSVIYAPGPSQSVLFVATGHGLQRVELPFAPRGLLLTSDGPQPVLFLIGEHGVLVHRLADPE